MLSAAHALALEQQHSQHTLFSKCPRVCPNLIVFAGFHLPDLKLIFAHLPGLAQMRVERFASFVRSEAPKCTKHAYQSRKRSTPDKAPNKGRPPREKTRHIHTALIGSGVVLPTRHMAGIPLPRRVRHNGTANLLVGDSRQLAASTADACASPLWDDAQEPAVASLPSLFQQTEPAHASQ